MTRYRPLAFTLLAAVAAAGCRAKPPAEDPPPPPVAAKDETPTFAATTAADVPKVEAAVAPLGGRAAPANLPAVPAVVVNFPAGGPKEADVPELARKLAATNVPVTVVMTGQPEVSAAAYGHILGVPNLRGLAAYGPNLFAALAALGDDSPLEYLSAGAPAVPADAALTKLRRLRALAIGGPKLPAAVLDRLAELPALHYLVFRGGTAAELPAVWRLSGLRTLYLDGGDFVDADLAPLATMVNLRFVAVTGPKVTKEAYTHLVDLPGLTYGGISPSGRDDTDAVLARMGKMMSAARFERLQLGGSAVTGAGLAHLGAFTGLTDLSLSGMPKADAAGLAVIAALPKLRELRIDTGFEFLPSPNPDVSPPRSRHPGVPPAAAFEGLAGAVAVKQLYLANATDAHLLHVGKMPQLEELVLSWSAETGPDGKDRVPEARITDAGLAHLRAAKKLRFLAAGGARLTDAGMAHLAALPALTELKLDGLGGPTLVTDAGAAELAKVKGLRVLTLYPTALTDAGVASLAALPDLRHFHVGSDAITDAVADEFLRIPNLEGGSFGGARTTQAGRDRLKAERPGLFRFPPR